MYFLFILNQLIEVFNLIIRISNEAYLDDQWNLHSKRCYCNG